MKIDRISSAVLEELRRLDSCTVADAIERFDVRLRNTGFVNASIRCMFEDLPPMIGYASTARARTSVPPMEGHSYADRTDWWNDILRMPQPRVVVIEDVDRRPGLGSLAGEVHAAILSALGCVGLVTNGAIRDLASVRQLGFQFFAGHVSVSHAYAHVFEFGTPVEIGGLRIASGDLLFGDRHGILQIPADIAAEIPAVARKMLEIDQQITKFCRAPDFSVEKLRSLIRELGL